MSCNLAGRQQVVVHMVRIEAMLEDEAGVVAVATVEVVSGIGHTEAICCSCSVCFMILGTR